MLFGLFQRPTLELTVTYKLTTVTLLTQMSGSQPLDLGCIETDHDGRSCVHVIMISDIKVTKNVFRDSKYHHGRALMSFIT